MDPVPPHISSTEIDITFLRLSLQTFSIFRREIRVSLILSILIIMSLMCFSGYLLLRLLSAVL